MYKRVETQISATMDNDAEVKPIATLKSENGGCAHIIKDDHCYMLVLERNGVCRKTAWIFREAFEVLRTLDSPK